MKKEEAIRLLKDKYHVEADLNNTKFNVFEQLAACESFSNIINETNEIYETNENVVVNGSVIDTHKQQVNYNLKSNKRKAMEELKTLVYKTPPRQVAGLLEIIFQGWDTKPGHWLYIAQNWNPRAINRVLNRIVKLHKTGVKTIKNPAAYFTFLIKKRKQRRDSKHQ